MNFQELRTKYPQYDDMDDMKLATGFHKKYYADMEFTDFAGRIGLKVREPAIVTPAQSARHANDPANANAALRKPEPMKFDQEGLRTDWNRRRQRAGEVRGELNQLQAEADRAGKPMLHGLSDEQLNSYVPTMVWFPELFGDEFIEAAHHERTVRRSMVTIKTLSPKQRAAYITGSNVTNLFGVNEWLSRAGKSPIDLAMGDRQGQHATDLEAAGRVLAEINELDPVNWTRIVNMGGSVGRTVLEFWMTPNPASKIKILARLPKAVQAMVSTGAKFGTHAAIQAPREGETLGQRAKDVGISTGTGVGVGAAGKFIKNPLVRVPAVTGGFMGLTAAQGGSTEDILETGATILGFEALGMMEKAWAAGNAKLRTRLKERAVEKAYKQSPALRGLPREVVADGLEAITAWKKKVATGKMKAEQWDARYGQAFQGLENAAVAAAKEAAAQRPAATAPRKPAPTAAPKGIPEISTAGQPGIQPQRPKTDFHAATSARSAQESETGPGPVQSVPEEVKPLEAATESDGLTKPQRQHKAAVEQLWKAGKAVNQDFREMYPDLVEKYEKNKAQSEAVADGSTQRPPATDTGNVSGKFVTNPRQGEITSRTEPDTRKEPVSAIYIDQITKARENSEKYVEIEDGETDPSKALGAYIDWSDAINDILQAEGEKRGWEVVYERAATGSQYISLLREVDNDDGGTEQEVLGIRLSGHDQRYGGTDAAIEINGNWEAELWEFIKSIPQPAPETAGAEKSEIIAELQGKIDKKEGRGPAEKITGDLQGEIERRYQDSKADGGIAVGRRNQLVKQTRDAIRKSGIYQSIAEGQETQSDEVGPGVYFISPEEVGDVLDVTGRPGEEGFDRKLYRMFTTDRGEGMPWDESVQENMIDKSGGMTDAHMDIGEFVRRVKDSIGKSKEDGGINRKALEEAAQSGDPESVMLAERLEMLEANYSADEINDRMHKIAADFDIPPEYYGNLLVEEAARPRGVKKQPPAMKVLQKARQSGKIDEGTYRLGKYLLTAVDPEFNVNSTIKIVDKVRTATAAMAAAEGLPTSVRGNDGQWHEQKYRIQGSTLSDLEAGATRTAIQLYRGHDADTLVEEWYHRAWDRLSEKEQKLYEYYHRKSGDVRGIKEHFAQEGRDFFFSEKLHEGTGTVRTIFAKARDSLRALINRIRELRGANIPAKIRDLYRKAGARTSRQTEATNPKAGEAALQMKPVGVGKRRGPNKKFGPRERPLIKARARRRRRKKPMRVIEGPRVSASQLETVKDIADKKAFINEKKNTYRQGFRRLLKMTVAPGQQGLTTTEIMDTMSSDEAEKFIYTLTRLPEPNYDDNTGKRRPPTIPRTTELTTKGFFLRDIKEPSFSEIFTSKTYYAELLGVKDLVEPLEKGKMRFDLEYQRMANAIEKKVKELERISGAKWHERFKARLLNQPTKGVASMWEALNFLEEPPAWFDDRQAGIFMWFRELTKEMLRRQNAGRVKLGIEPIKERKAYIRHVADDIAQEMLEGRYPFPQGRKFWAEKIVGKKTYNAMEMRRTLSGDLVDLWNQDVGHAMKSMLWTALKEIHLNQPIRYFRAVMAALGKDKPVYKTLDSIEEAQWANTQVIPASTRKWLQEYVNVSIKGQETEFDARVNRMITKSGIDKAINVLLRPFGRTVGRRPVSGLFQRVGRSMISGVMGRRPKQIIRNKFQLVQNLALYSTKATAKGFLKPTGALQRLMDESLFLKSYTGLEELPVDLASKAEAWWLKWFQWSAVSNASQSMRTAYWDTLDLITNSEYKELGWADAQRDYTEPPEYLYPSEKKKMLKEMEFGAGVTQYQYNALGMPGIYRHKTLIPFTRLSSWWMNHFFKFHREALTRAFTGKTSYGEKLPWSRRLGWLRYAILGGLILNTMNYTRSYMFGAAPTGTPPLAQFLQSLYKMAVATDERGRKRAKSNMAKTGMLFLPGYLAYKDYESFLSGRKDLWSLFFYQKRKKKKTASGYN